MTIFVNETFIIFKRLSGRFQKNDPDLLPLCIKTNPTITFTITNSELHTILSFL